LSKSQSGAITALLFLLAYLLLILEHIYSRTKKGCSMRRTTFLLFQLFLAIFAAYAVMYNVPNDNLLVPLACLLTMFLLGKHPQAQTEFVIWWEE
jgi:hypothetical protein